MKKIVSYQVFSKLLRHYRRKIRAVTLGKGRCNNCGKHKLEKSFISQLDSPPPPPPPPTFNCLKGRIIFLLNERYKKDKKCRFIFTAAFAHIYQ